MWCQSSVGWRIERGEAVRGEIVKKIRREAFNARNQAIGVAGQMTQALNTNEEKTRQRVDKLENDVGELRSNVLRFRARGLRARLRWLFFGK